MKQPLTRTAPAAVLALLFAFLIALPALAAPKLPELTGRVVDDAHVLSDATEASLTDKLKTLEDRTGRQLVVMTTPSLGDEPIEDFGVRLLRGWAIGQKGTNNGAIFIVAPNDRKVRVEVGYGLEDVLTDALSSVILQRAVLPKFRSGDVEGGVVAGTDQLVEQLSLGAPEAQARIAEAAKPKHRKGFPLGGLIPLIILFIVFSTIFRGGRRRRGGLGAALPALILADALTRRGGSSWGGGGGWSGGGGGGGFSGGGGSGGGGGASGSW